MCLSGLGIVPQSERSSVQFWSGHKPVLRAMSSFGGVQLTDVSLSHGCFSPSSPLSINEWKVGRKEGRTDGREGGMDLKRLLGAGVYGQLTPSTVSTLSDKIKNLF